MYIPCESRRPEELSDDDADTAFNDREFSMPEIRKTAKRKLREEFESEMDTLDSASVWDDDDSRSHASQQIGKRKSEVSEGERLLKDLTSSVSSLAENAKNSIKENTESHDTFSVGKIVSRKIKADGAEKSGKVQNSR